jgi:DNA polymerase
LKRRLPREPENCDVVVRDFASWRETARNLICAGVPPERAHWQDEGDEQTTLFEQQLVPPGSGEFSISRNFLKLAATAAMHSAPDRWSLLYRILWRITRGERRLLELEIDDDVQSLNSLCRSVSQDIYRMRQFVRFRRIEGDHYVAWYRPEHDTVLANAPFFTERFGSMRWAIFTPRRSIHWDLVSLREGPGVPRSAAPAEDQLEDLWRVYYRAVFNPARLNLNAMRAQLPLRNWIDLPEARSIGDLVRESRGAVQNLVQSGRAPAPVPVGTTLATFRARIPECRACELCRLATQPVPGEGPEHADLMLVGEQPGDEEDLAGRPFIGPAGAVLDEALQAAGLDRSRLYITNAVKAFRFEERGKRRIHQRPRSSHIGACRPWLMGEIEIVRPRALVCLGATAAQSVLGRAVNVGAERGRKVDTSLGAVVVSYHPSAALRAGDVRDSARIRECLRDDLIFARAVCRSSGLIAKPG